MGALCCNDWHNEFDEVLYKTTCLVPANLGVDELEGVLDEVADWLHLLN